MRLPSDFDDIPAYGTLTQAEESLWDKKFHYCWQEYAKVEMKNRLVNGSSSFINANWPLMSAEYKAAVWALMNDEERKRIREVRANEA